MITEKAISICLLEILKEYSDEENIMSVKDITEKMKTVYGLKPDRRTVYSAIALLTDLGYDISTYEENKKGYCLRGRDIERSEVVLLSDAVYAFPFISAKQSETLINKLQKTLSKHQRRRYNHLKIVKPEKKTDNKQVFLNIEVLNEAVSLRKQVHFTYMKYGLDKKLHPRREKPYTVNPYQLVYTNEHYYLICNMEGYSDMSMYRVDRMKDIVITNTNLTMECDGGEATDNAVYGFTGKPEIITIICSNVIIDDVIEKFGSDVWLDKVDEKHFKATLKASPMGVKFWALQYLPYAEVIRPQSLRDEIIESLKENKYLQTGEAL